MAASTPIVVKVDMSCDFRAVEKIISGIRARGFAVELTQDGGLAVTPASKLQPHDRELIRSNKAAIVDYLTAANDPAPDPDRWAWPNGTAANTRELALMANRLARFARIGLSVDDAERMADKLQQRDREHDDRHACLECASLSGRWRCAAFRQRGATAPGLPLDYTMMLTRCNAWRAAV